MSWTRTRRQSVREEEEEEEGGGGGAEETTMNVAFLLQERFKAYREVLSKSSSVEDGEGVCGAIDAFVDKDDDDDDARRFDDDENAKVFFFDDSFREEFRECCFSATTLTKNQTRTRRRCSWQHMDKTAPKRQKTVCQGANLLLPGQLSKVTTWLLWTVLTLSGPMASMGALLESQQPRTRRLCSWRHIKVLG